MPGKKLPASPPAAPPPAAQTVVIPMRDIRVRCLQDLNLIFGGAISRFEFLLGFKDAHKQAGCSKDGSGVGNELYDAVRYIADPCYC